MSGMACTTWLSIIRCSFPLTPLSSTQVSWCTTWVTNIIFILHISVCQSLTWPDNIFHSMHTSVFRCPTGLATIVCSLQKLFCWHRIWSVYILCSLRTYVCKYWPMTSRISQRLHAFVMACSYLVKDLIQWHASSVMVRTRWWGMCISCKKRWTKVCDINQVLHEQTWHV